MTTEGENFPAGGAGKVRPAPSPTRVVIVAGKHDGATASAYPSRVPGMIDVWLGGDAGMVTIRRDWTRPA